MLRAAIAIGVNKSGDLPVLRAAARNAKDFAAWAQHQSFDHIAILTDDDPAISAVTAAAILNAIKPIVNDRTYTQIIVYFAGHGILMGPNTEYWLLSDARDDPNEAVNVAASINAARRVGIPHVVFISDACRSRPAKDWQTAVYGSVIFPTKSPQPKGPAVDRFYATLPGDPAREAELDAAARNYDGLFTRCLLQALQSSDGTVVEDWTDPPPPVRVIPAWKLADYLEVELPKLAAKVSLTLTQYPDAQVESRKDKYLAKVTAAGITRGAETPSRHIEIETYPIWRPPTPPAPAQLAQVASRHGLSPFFPSRTLGPVSLRPEHDFHWEEHDFDHDVQQVLNAEGRSSFETRTGFTVVGIPVLRAAATGGVACEVFEERSEHGPNQVRVHLPEQADLNTGVSAVLQFANGSGVCLAVLPGFIATVVVRGESVLTVNYTPSRNTEAYFDFEAEQFEIERRRAFAAAAAQRGSFRIDLREADTFARYFQEFRHADPTLGLYAAYAYAQIGDARNVYSVLAHLRQSRTPVLFDVALLADQIGVPDLSVAPACPLLVQGWALLGPYRELVPPVLLEASRQLIPGLWTTFAPAATESLLAALAERRWR